MSLTIGIAFELQGAQPRRAGEPPDADAENPSASELVEIACASAAIMRDFKQEPKVAFVCNSNFGAVGSSDAAKMREAVRLMDEAGVDFEYDGEMHVDTAMDPALRERIFPDGRLHGPANLLVMPNASAASVAATRVAQTETRHQPERGGCTRRRIAKRGQHAEPNLATIAAAGAGNSTAGADVDDA